MCRQPYSVVASVSSEYCYGVLYFFLYNSTQNVLASFIQNTTNISVIRAAIATSQQWRYEWALRVV